MKGRQLQKTDRALQQFRKFREPYWKNVLLFFYLKNSIVKVFKKSWLPAFLDANSLMTWMSNSGPQEPPFEHVLDVSFLQDTLFTWSGSLSCLLIGLGHPCFIMSVYDICAALKNESISAPDPAYLFYRV